MAKGKKTGGRNFEAGQSGNPQGRPPQPEALREAKRLFRDQFEQLVLDLQGLTLGQLQGVIDDPNTPALKLGIATALAKGISLGDTGRMSFFLDRLVGPVPKAVELSGADGQPLPPLVSHTSAELTVLLAEIHSQIKERKCKASPQSLPPSSAGSPVSSRQE